MDFRKTGFSLIELLVTVAIIAILSAIAFSSYKVYSVRAKVASVMPLMNKLQTEVMRYYETTGQWPSGNTLGYPVTGMYFDNPTSYNPYLAALFIMWGSATNCPPSGNSSEIVLIISGSLIGTTFNNIYASPYNGNYLLLRSQAYTSNNGTVMNFLSGSFYNSIADTIYLPVGWQTDQSVSVPTCT